MKKKFTFFAICCLFVIVLLSIRPLFRSDFFHLHDYTHVARLVEMDKALKDGQFPVRWAADLGWGYGMPLFNFYAPLPYLVAEVFHLSGFSFLNSIKIVFGLTSFLAFLGMYFLSTRYWGKFGGLLAATAFVLSPYRAVDFYVRGALGELFAISLLPFVIWSIFELIDRKNKKYLVISSFFIALLVLSHTVLTLICLPLILLVAIFYLTITKSKLVIWLNFIASFILGIGLSAFFLLPAFFEKQYTGVDVLTQGFSHYSHHFLYFRQFISGTWGYGGSVDSIPDGMSFHLGKVHLFLAGLSLLSSFFILVKEKKLVKRFFLILFFSALILCFAFLSTYKAKFIWDAIPIMAYIQFPWRFNSVIIVFLGFLIGSGAFFIKKFNYKATVIFAIFSILLLLFVNLKYFKPEGYINPEGLYYTDKEKIKKQMSGIIPDYIPKWVEDEPKQTAENEYKILKGEADVMVLSSKIQKLDLEIKNQDTVKLQLNKFYFPGWEVVVNNEKEKLNYKDNNGIMYINIADPGRKLISLEFKDTPIRKLSNLLSLISIILTGIILIYESKK